MVSFPGQGTVLFGDKTLLKKPSAFDRINVRRLFIVLEKAIATAAKFSLFELNDRFTRAQFKNLIEPFLLDVQSRRGITDFKVVCDETNNTPDVIDRNEFVADIFVQPTTVPSTSSPLTLLPLELVLTLTSSLGWSKINTSKEIIMRIDDFQRRNWWRRKKRFSLEWVVELVRAVLMQRNFVLGDGSSLPASNIGETDCTISWKKYQNSYISYF